MVWNFDEAAEREGTDSIKYDLRKEIFGDQGIIPMWVADMDFRAPDFLVESLQQVLDRNIYGYSFRPPEYYSSIISWLLQRHSWKVEKEWICFSPGVVPALNMCTLAFTSPGDKIIVQPPVYFPFFSATEAHGRKLNYNVLKEAEGKWVMDIDSLIASIDSRTKMIMFCNPHNPTGRSWTREELLKLAGICLEKNILILSDEIHSDLMMPGHTHTPVASLDEKLREITITCIAPSKTFNLAGLSTSSVIIPNPDLRKAFNRISENLHITNGNIFGTAASVSVYTNGHKWLDELLIYLNGNVELVMNFCRESIPEIVPCRPEATYMIWLDCRAMGMSGKDLQKFFVARAGIGMNEGSTFGPGGEGFMRMNIAAPRSTVMRALEQMEKAVKTIR